MKAGYVINNEKYADPAKVTAFGCTRVGWEAQNPNLSSALIEETRRDRGVTIFLGFDPIWDNYPPPLTWAKRVSGRLTALGLGMETGGIQKQCSILADIEVHDSDYILPALQEIRRLRPGRGLTFTCEPHQGGIMSDALGDFINRDPMVTISPQCYGGQMQGYSEWYVVKDLLLRGIARDKILPFFGRHVLGWDGFLYDLNNVGDLARAA